MPAPDCFAGAHLEYGMVVAVESIQTIAIKIDEGYTMRLIIFSSQVLIWLPLAASAAVSPVGTFPYPEPAWSPYIAGGLIGLLLVFSVGIAGKKIGASSAYMSLVGLMGRIIMPRHFRRLDYYRDNPPAVGWTLALVLGAAAGAFVAAWSGGEITGTYLQDIWIARFGADSHVLRTLFAFAGGIFIAIGARIAGGCTSGHGISGTAQMAIASWVAVLSFFVGGIVTALLIYRI